MSIRPADIPEIVNLTVPEKIQLVEDLWDSIPDNADLPIPPEQIVELEARRKHYEANPESALSLEELQARIAARRT